MKSKFLAGVIATLITLVAVVGIAIAMVSMGFDETSKPLIYGAAFAAIGIWTGVYKWLKPKDPPQDNNGDYVPPARETEI